jgi:hypothetical protein
MGGHVIYERRLELARLLLADFDRDVAGRKTSRTSRAA